MNQCARRIFPILGRKFSTRYISASHWTRLDTSRIYIIYEFMCDIVTARASLVKNQFVYTFTHTQAGYTRVTNVALGYASMASKGENCTLKHVYTRAQRSIHMHRENHDLIQPFGWIICAPVELYICSIDSTHFHFVISQCDDDPIKKGRRLRHAVGWQ